MKRIFPLFLLISFILWILPLGVFIKPSLEKLACDGQRAMCMCRVMMPKSSGKPMEAGMVLKTVPAQAKENSSPAGNYFLSNRPTIILNLSSVLLFENPHLFYKNPTLALLDQVPKV